MYLWLGDPGFSSLGRQVWFALMVGGVCPLGDHKFQHSCSVVRCVYLGAHKLSGGEFHHCENDRCYSNYDAGRRLA